MAEMLSLDVKSHENLHHHLANCIQSKREVLYPTAVPPELFPNSFNVVLTSLTGSDIKPQT
jgi:hypothetical protein